MHTSSLSYTECKVKNVIKYLSSLCLQLYMFKLYCVQNSSACDAINEWHFIPFFPFHFSKILNLLSSHAGDALSVHMLYLHRVVKAQGKESCLNFLYKFFVCRNNTRRIILAYFPPGFSSFAKLVFVFLIFFGTIHDLYRTMQIIVDWFTVLLDSFCIGTVLRSVRGS